MLHKKTFLQSFFKTIIAFILLVIFSSAIPLGSTAASDHITLTWMDDPRTTQTITWRTDVTTVVGRVQYCEAVGKSFPHNARTVDAGVEDFGNMSIHSVTLTGLKPGTNYIYQVSAESTWGELHTFTTSSTNASSFKFLVFGDSQSSNYDVWQATLHQAYQANPDAVFFTNVGDLVDVGQDYTQWNSWFDATQGIIDRIPAMPVTGNHETYTPERRFSMPIFFTAQFKLPTNGPEFLKRQVYSFDYGDVHFVILDSQKSEEERFVPGMLDSQKAWLEQDLTLTDKKWKVVFVHRSPYDNKLARNNDSIREAFVPILDKYHVDVVFTAHDHVYARTYPLYGDAVMDSPAKGTIYVATGRSGTKTYQDVSAKEWNEFFYNPQDTPNYITVEVSKGILMVKAFKQSNVLIDAWTIDKMTGLLRDGGM